MTHHDAVSVSLAERRGGRTAGGAARRPLAGERSLRSSSLPSRPRLARATPVRMSAAAARLASVTIVRRPADWPAPAARGKFE